MRIENVFVRRYQHPLVFVAKLNYTRVFDRLFFLSLRIGKMFPEAFYGKSRLA